MHYDNACHTFLSNHPGRQITKLQFGSLLSEAWGRAATPGTASNGFRACGIFPLNKDAIPDNAFMPSTVSDVPLTDASTDQASGRPAVIAPATTELPSAVPSTAESTFETPPEPAAIRSTSPVNQMVTEIVTQTDPVATHAVSSTPTKTTSKTFAMLSRLMHTELHWLDVPERVQYKLGVLMYRGQHNQAPRYLTDHCTPVSDTVFRQLLRSASSHQVSVPVSYTHLTLPTKRIV